MTSTSSSTTAALVTGSLLVAASLYMGWSRQQATTTTTSTSRELAEIDDVDAADTISAEEVAKIFDRLFMEAQGVFSNLMQQIQQIKMSGQNIPEQQLQALLKGEMERSLAGRQTAVLEEMDMDYECLEEATWEFLADEGRYPNVKRSVDRFQKFWESTTGHAATGWRKGGAVSATPAPVLEVLDAPRTVEVAEKYFAGITGGMRELVLEYKRAGKDLQQPAVQNALHMDFANKANGAGEAALEAVGVSMPQFEASIKAHAQDKSVGQALAMLQMKQQQELSTMSSMPV
jgi:hypothetical protein